MTLRFLRNLRLRRLQQRLILLFGGLCLTAVVSICVVSYSNSIRPEGIIIHHAALPSVVQGRRLDAEVLDRVHAQRGFGVFYWGRIFHTGYHFIILPDGTLQQGRPVHCRGAHAEGYNSFIGICLIGNFSTKDNPGGERGLSEPSESQLRTLRQLILRLQESEGIPPNRVLRHADVSPNTDCPGDRFPTEPRTR